MNKILVIFAGLLMSSFAVASVPSEQLDSKCESVVVAIVKVKPGSETVFKAAATDVLAPTRLEEGNKSYDFQQSSTDPTIFTTYEKWVSAEDLGLHMATDHMQKFFGIVGPLFETGYPIIHQMQNIECSK